ncbi:hypothetical protein BJ508DRAFT_301233 [Ascobolus immersus RN42]|uniref:Uncharacterized protein n=1 Tax=Ascobolus immersus RN42 TaxID=1160509 RepID=A0A3N4IN46_ASCIM|nr:hypothetical protein BJ508DRAFT_301233 [Ascobolus immersus RN42]
MARRPERVRNQQGHWAEWGPERSRQEFGTSCKHSSPSDRLDSTSAFFLSFRIPNYCPNGTLTRDELRDGSTTPLTQYDAASRLLSVATLGIYFWRGTERRTRDVARDIYGCLRIEEALCWRDSGMVVAYVRETLDSNATQEPKQKFTILLKSCGIRSHSRVAFVASPSATTLLRLFTAQTPKAGKITDTSCCYEHITRYCPNKTVTRRTFQLSDENQLEDVSDLVGTGLTGTSLSQRSREENGSSFPNQKRLPSLKDLRNTYWK